MRKQISIIEGAYLHDLLAQPDTLRAVRQGLAELNLDSKFMADWRAGRFARVMLTGMGSSFHALYPLHRRLTGRGVVSHWIETSEFLHGFAALRRTDTLLIAVSQSGESAEIVSLMEHSPQFGHVIGITNNENSTLGIAAGSRLLLHAGAESTVSCKTYTATLAALPLLSALLADGDLREPLKDLEQAEFAMRQYLARWREHVIELVPLLEDVTSIFVTGRGDSLATAGTGGLILKESTRQPAEGMSAAAFRHGPLEMAGENVLVLVIEGSESVAALNRRLVADITRGGGRAALMTTSDFTAKVFRLPMVPESVSPMIEILPVQMLSLALAARDGFEAGRFVRASKITNIA